MGSKSEEFLYEYKITNRKTGEVFQARGWSNVINLAGLSKGYPKHILEKTKKWMVEVTADPEQWDEAAYRQSLYAKNKQRYREYECKKKERDPLFESRKRLRLKGHRNYDGSPLTAEQHDKMLGYKCEVCGVDYETCVDHCHKTGYVRGTLCNKCNLALGFARDSIEILENLRKYLMKHETKMKEIN